MPAVKTYTRVNFQNYPSTSTPLNATNLNKMDKGIDDLDDEVVTVKNAIENMSFDADSISYDNTSSGLQATDVQDAVDEINDNLNGFKYYPSGTQLVALVADDSFYTDANGKYVLADSPTGESLIDDITYKSLASNEDLRGEVGADTVSPFNSGGVKETAIVTALSVSSISTYLYQIINKKNDTIQSYMHQQNTAGQLDGEYISIIKYTYGTNPTLVFKAKKQGKYRIYELDAIIGGSQSYSFIEEKTCNANDIILGQSNWGWGNEKPQFVVKAI